MDFQDLEAVEGLRFSWNAWPTTRLEASRCAVPFGIICHPLQLFPDLPRLPYGPIQCSACQAVLNPYCPVNFNAKKWNCCICSTVNKFPKSHSSISQDYLPAELFPTHNVVEYCLPQPQAKPPAIVYVIDTGSSSEDLGLMVNAVLGSLRNLPGDVSVGLVTFGSMINIHILRPQRPLSSSILVPGDKPVPPEKVGDLVDHLKLAMGLVPPEVSAQPVLGVERDGVELENGSGLPQAAVARDWAVDDLLAPLEGYRESLESALRAVTPDATAACRKLRPMRTTGSALAAALALLEGSVPSGSRGRIVAVLSGPCTAGPGLVVERDLSDQMRSHHDINARQTLHYRTASAFYSALGDRIGEQGFALDVFACCPDQVGLAEMRGAVEQTGGTMLFADTPECDTFSGSLQKLLGTNEKGELDACHHGTLEARTSEGVRLAGAIGPCLSLRRRGGSGPCKWTSDTMQVGQSGTWAWRLPCLGPGTAVAVVFEVAFLSMGDVLPDSTLFIQLCTSFVDSSGLRKCRVCTVGRRWKLLRSVGEAVCSSSLLGLEAAVEGGVYQEEAAAALFDVVTGFDQEAAAAIVARMAVAMMEHQSPEEVLRWLDRMLVRFGAKFGRYTPSVAPSFRLAPNLFLFPSFVYHLRRSPFLQIFNSSPDDSAFRRTALFREGVPGSILMVQPSLVSYALSSPPQHVALDLTAVKADSILLYDSFFELVVHHGSTIAQWRKAGYQGRESNQALQRLLEEPLQAAGQVAKERWLQPRLIVCDQNDSLSRFLTYRLSPAPVEPGINGDSAMAYIAGDDASLQSFISHFHHLAVQS